jgi:catechol 2,3-dioxygenase-like lactoylglutathione lyase family enzyme
MLQTISFRIAETLPDVHARHTPQRLRDIVPRELIGSESLASRRCCEHEIRIQTPGGGDGPVQAEQGFPQLAQVVLDCTDARALAEFYRRLLGWRYRPGDQPPTAGDPDPAGQDWLVLRDGAGRAQVAFQQVAVLPEATWPVGPVPQQMHLDLTVPTTTELDVQHERALTLGARLLHDRSDDPEEPLRVYADPAGHPFCIFVAN